MLAILTEAFNGFPQSPYGNAGVVCGSCHDHVLPDHFQLIHHRSSYLPMLRCVSTESVVKQRTKWIRHPLVSLTYILGPLILFVSFLFLYLHREFVIKFPIDLDLTSNWYKSTLPAAITIPSRHLPLQFHSSVVSWN